MAVLPFVNSGGDPDTEYLSDGITESLINKLSRLRTLRVSARSTVFRYKGKEADPQAVGRNLGVRSVLSGRLARQRYIPALAFAVVHVGLDEKDQAFAWLDKAYDERANRLAYLAFEPTWARLRSDPRFDDLLRRIGLPQ